MSCTNCALSVDKVLTGSGMQDVKVNFMNGEASFSAPENTNKKNIQKEVEALGYEVSGDGLETEQKSKKYLVRRCNAFGFALLLQHP